MIEIIFALIIFALIGFIAWREKHFSQERRDLIAGILSKDVQQFTIATQTPKKEEAKPVISSDYIAEETLTDDEFFEAVKETNK